MTGINLASCFGFLSQKQRNLCSTPWLSRWTNVKVSMSPNPNLWGCLLSTVQTQNLSHPFWQAGAENMISNHDRGQNRKDFSGDSSDGTFPSDLYSANAPPRCSDLNSSLNNCIHACIARIHSLDFPVLFFHPRCGCISVDKSFGWASQHIFGSLSIKAIMYTRARGTWNICSCKTDTLLKSKGTGLDLLAVACGFIFIRWRLLKLENRSITSLHHLLSSWIENENINMVVSLGKEKMKNHSLCPSSDEQEKTEAIPNFPSWGTDKTSEICWDKDVSLYGNLELQHGFSRHCPTLFEKEYHFALQQGNLCKPM